MWVLIKKIINNILFLYLPPLLWICLCCLSCVASDRLCFPSPTPSVPLFPREQLRWVGAASDSDKNPGSCFLRCKSQPVRCPGMGTNLQILKAKPKQGNGGKSTHSFPVPCGHREEEAAPWGSIRHLPWGWRVWPTCPQRVDAGKFC